MEAPSGTFSRSEERLTQELSLKEISQIFLNNWLLFILMFIVLSTTAVILYIYKIPYVGQSSITVNDTQNSSLQSFATQYFGLSKLVADGKKNNSPLLKHAEYLKTSDFFEKLLANIQKRGESSELTIPEAKGYQTFKNEYLTNLNEPDAKIKVLATLDSLSKIKLDSDFELKVSFSAPTKEVALFLTNTALQTTLASLKERELSDILKVETFIKNQISETEKNIQNFNKQLAEFQNKPENLISLSSKDKVGEYISELMVRKNEMKMKIAENQKIIDYLSQGQSNRRESQLYGNGGRIQALKLEIQMLQNHLANLQASVDRVTSMAKSIPVTAQFYDDLKKKSEIEFDKYKNLSEALSKAEAQKLSVESRFEVLESARFEKTVPMISLTILFLIVVLLTQILSSMVIYINYIWDSNTVTAQSSRNVVIIDSHSLDPRVIIENSKIKFRLRNTKYDESNYNNDLEDFGSRKLTFRLFNKKSANGESDVSSDESI